MKEFPCLKSQYSNKDFSRRDLYNQIRLRVISAADVVSDVLYIALILLRDQYLSATGLYPHTPATVVKLNVVSEVLYIGLILTDQYL